MKNLQASSLPPKSIFDDIVKSKYNPARAGLLLIQQHVEARFDEYDKNKLNLENLTTSLYLKKTDNHKYLVSCYESKTDKFNEMIIEIKEKQPSNTKGICQYCCINSPKTIDHYLPKSIFPEFSVFTLNLIPCCADCNQLKDEKFKDSSNIREFINFYFDDFLNSQFLFCHVIIDNNIPIVKFFTQKTNHLSSNNYKIIESHFSNLQLFDRYKDNINGLISEIENVCKSLISNGLDKKKVKDTLFDISKRNKQTFGVNYWKAVLEEGLATCQDFIDSL